MKANDPEMPPSYESSTAQKSSWFSIQKEYVTTIPGILKIAQMVISMIAFISSMVDPWAGAGWVRFATISAFIGTLIYFLLYLLNYYQRIPGPWTLVEFVYYCVYTVFLFISACVSAAKGGVFDSAAASAFFCFLATAVYGVDCFFKFKVLRSERAAAAAGGPRGVQAGTTVTTTQTTTTVERVETY
ncbi:DgyrCDS5219 [Dimorphilus gyrociliatus]|uniref:DgyrCDS5219 n=1 Tax=Dimorphilus gyrociliatus TaxID=2664684 RepID=A0A7I8VJB8_9ANNE|nr:DgyrCDS5219 [Dimorphilus gyrociliatus]